MGDEAARFVIKQKYLTLLVKLVKAATSAGLYSHEGDAAEVGNMLNIGMTLKSQ